MAWGWVLPRWTLSLRQAVRLDRQDVLSAAGLVGKFCTAGAYADHPPGSASCPVIGC